MLTLRTQPNQFTIFYGETEIFTHHTHNPALFIGVGHENMEMYRGNFNISDYVERRIPLSSVIITSDTKVGNADGACEESTVRCDAQLATAESHTSRIQLAFFTELFTASNSADSEAILTAELIINQAGQVEMSFTQHAKEYNRLWVRTPAEQSAPVWGCGEQMSYFNLRGRNFPLWTSEPGVGRDKSTYITWRSDVENKAGGDYYHTNYPQPTFVSLTPSNQQVYAIHANTTAYAEFDFSHDTFHELQFWAIPNSLVWFTHTNLTDLISALSLFFGRQPKLPEWIIRGAILGLKRGEDHAKTRLADALKHGVNVAGVWCEDWSGIRETSFGVRLFWDWQWNKSRYPDLKNWIKELNQQDIQFLAYTNPYLCVDGPLYQEAKSHGYLATKQDGSDYAVDFGEFDCGVVDFTIQAAQDWFSERIIQKEMLDLGIKGWMADFGEYLPIDLKLSDNSDPKHRHNEWPVLWSKVNADAIEAKQQTGEAVFFMRAGYSGVQRYCPLLWGGDQSVDFTRHDGLVTVMPAALSSGLLGNAYHHSDIGGYTSLFGNVRTGELFMRWAEMNVFTPVMRTHEGNRPTENFQFWQDETVYAHFAKMTQWHVALVPYVKLLIDEAAATGLPLQRALVINYQHDENCFDLFNQYLYGRDLLVAPIHEAGADARSVYLPKGDDWRHIWQDKVYQGGQTVEISAPIGKPAVFIRECAKDRAELADFLSIIKHSDSE